MIRFAETARLLAITSAAFALASCIGTVGVIPVGVIRHEGTPDTAPREPLNVDVQVSAREFPQLPELDAVVTPLYARIENHSGRPLELRYADLALHGAAGGRAGALPPFPLRGRIRNVFRPAITGSGFYVAPAFARYFPGWQVWSGALRFDAARYEQDYHRWDSELPTPEMTDAALPEGVLADGGHVEGYLYFDHPLQAGDKAVTFEQQLVDAKTGKAFGTIRIPFTITVARR